MSKTQEFEKCGVVLISPTKKSLRFELRDPDTVFLKIYYIGLNDLDKVLKGKKETATVVRVKDRGVYVEDSKG